MILPRASARWAGRISLQSSKARPSSGYRHARRSVRSRAYATAGGESGQSTHKSSSDLPWAIGSLVVTVPAVAYLIQPQLRPKASHGHGHGDEGHGNEHGEEEEHEEKDEGEDETESSERKAAEEESDDQGAGGEKSEEGNADEGGSNENNEEEGESESGGKHGPATPGDKGPDPEAHETEGGGNVEGVRFKGATSGGTKEGEQGDTRKHIPDAKGGSKKRIESDYAKRQGEATEPEQDPKDLDLGAASKATGKAGSSTTQSSKQEGLSNTDTKHSTDIQSNPAKSNKGEGMPETAKLKGTVDPRRPQA